MKQIHCSFFRSVAIRPPLVLPALAFIIAGALFLSACGGPERPNPALEQARMLFEQAKADPQVMEKAPLEMHEAGKTLDRAEDAEETADKEHLAYVARRQVELAMAEARKKAAQERMEGMSRENQNILLDVRRRESETKTREAEVARQEALRLKAEAEARALEAQTRTEEARAARDQAERALARARQLEEELTELQAQQTERGLVLTLGDVLFDTGKSDLKAGAQRSIDKLAQFLSENPERQVIVEGHTDAVGNDAYNLTLSQQRADAVKAALIIRGVAPGRIISRGYGEAYPVASNATDSGRQQNRRVEVIVLNAGVSGESMLR